MTRGPRWQRSIIGDTNHDREIADDLGAEFVHFDGGHQSWSGETRCITALRELVDLLTPASDRPDPAELA
ncbi:hypothetical protein ACI2IP_14700 [Microbacterium sp. NPDC090218]